MNITKTITLTLGDHEFEVPVNFRAIEIAESVFDASADTILATILTDPRKIRRSMIAHVISQWVTIPKGMKRSEIYEQAVVVSPDQLGAYVGAIQGAIAYALNYIDQDDLNALVRGEDLPDAPAGDQSGKSEASSETATK